MVWLLLLIVCFAAFNLSFRQAQRLGLNLHLLGAILFTAGGVLYLALYRAAPAPLSATVMALALVAGVLFTGMYVLMIPTMSDRGVSLMTALQQLSVLVPMAVSLALYREHPSLVNAIGAGLCLVAMPFLTLDRGVSQAGVTGRKLLLFLSLMLVNGIALTAAKVFNELAVPEQLNGYMMILMLTAAGGCLPFAYAAVRRAPRKRYGRETWGWGIYLGLVLALGFVGIALAVVAIVLVNL